MANMTGMDIDAIRTMATKIKNEKGQLEQKISSLDSAIKTVEQIWKGNDSKEFLNQWTSQYYPSLKKLVEELEQFAAKATKNAMDQENVSRGL